MVYSGSMETISFWGKFCQKTLMLSVFALLFCHTSDYTYLRTRYIYILMPTIVNVSDS